MPLSHRERGRQILRAHPEVRTLMGHNPVTALIAAAVIALQIAVAFGLSRLAVGWPWGVLIAIVAAFFVGAHAVHALYAVIHEATHRLVFRGRVANRLVMLACNLPLALPFAVALSHYHLVHHSRLGELGRDPDIPSAWENRAFAGGPWRKAAFAFAFPVLQLFRPTHAKDRIPLSDPWLVANVVAQLAVTALLVWQLGGVALVYLLVSVYFWAGPHPVLFGRYIQEHFVMSEDGEETHSYYGPLNRISLNVGYHVEHHDLASIPWNRLPRLTRMASSFYGQRTRHESWWKVVRQFLADRRVQVASRTTGSLATEGAQTVSAARSPC